MKLKELIAIALVTVFSFPVMYLAMLLATGNMRIEFGRKEQSLEISEDVEVVQRTFRDDSLAAAHSQAYLALRKEREELEQERSKLAKDRERFEMMQQDLERSKEALDARRRKLEKLVAEADELNRKRIKQVAKVYGAMRASEAAAILETLDDNLCIDILNNINDDRQKAKIVAGLSRAKAARISSTMGKPVTAGRP